jgi:hypothetical protein
MKEIAMAKIETDPYGSTETSTAYTGQERPASRSGYGRSAWALAFVTVFLVSLAAAVLLWPSHSTDPAPVGSAGTGIVREPSPASNKQ